MKKYLLLSMVCLISLQMMSQINLTTYYYTIQVGETITLNDQRLGYSTFDNAIISVTANYGMIKKVTGINPGIAVVRLGGYASESQELTQSFYTVHVIKVVAVKNITIPQNLSLKTAETFTIQPIITDDEATKSLTWTSSNTSVATVNASGVVQAVSVGKATIVCKAANGVSAQCLVSVSPVLAQSVILSQKECEISVGDELQLTPTITPANVTSSTIKWMSTNENIAQVDDEGNVTAIGSGYCSIYSLADDGSGKFDRCLIHVLGDNTIGDINKNGKIDIGDAVMIVNFIVGKTESLFPND